MTRLATLTGGSLLAVAASLAATAPACADRLDRTDDGVEVNLEALGRGADSADRGRIILRYPGSGRDAPGRVVLTYPNVPTPRERPEPPSTPAPAPDLAVSEDAAPEVTAPEVTALEVTALEVAPPEIAAPEVAAPDVAALEDAATPFAPDAPVAAGTEAAAGAAVELPTIVATPDAEDAGAPEMPAAELPEPAPAIATSVPPALPPQAVPPPQAEPDEGPAPQATARLETPPASARPAPTGALGDPPPAIARIAFDADAATLVGTARDELDAVDDGLRFDVRRIELRAHAGSPGETSSDARRLSLKRGLAVRQYLIDRGIDPRRIDVRALGGASDAGAPDRVDIVYSGS